MEMTRPVHCCVDNNETMYYNSKDLQIYDPLFYWGCKTKPRNIIKKKQICESEYLFATLKNGRWNISTSKCKKSQLLISKNWVETNMKSMKNTYLYCKRVYDDIDISLETINLLEKIRQLEEDIEKLKIKHLNEVENERCEVQFLQLQLENNLQFSKLKEEKYLLQIQMLQK